MQIGLILTQMHKEDERTYQCPARENSEKMPAKNLNGYDHVLHNVSHLGTKSAVGDISYLSKSDINDQWYNFIFEDGEKSVSEFKLDKTDLDKSAISKSRMSNISRFSMQSNLSQFQNISIFKQSQNEAKEEKVSGNILGPQFLEGLDLTHTTHTGNVEAPLRITEKGKKNGQWPQDKTSNMLTS